ncbi:MAG: hypothetical protein R3E95_03840 [Thiolinea sp.]
MNDANGAAIASTSTAPDGSYRFANLDTSLTYRIAVATTDPDLLGKVIGTPNPLSGVTVTAGNTTTNQNFGFDEPAPSCGAMDLSTVANPILGVPVPWGIPVLPEPLPKSLAGKMLTTVLRITCRRIMQRQWAWERLTSKRQVARATNTS